jgi:hypothetical protein
MYIYYILNSILYYTLFLVSVNKSLLRVPYFIMQVLIKLIV